MYSVEKAFAFAYGKKWSNGAPNHPLRAPGPHKDGAKPLAPSRPRTCPLQDRFAIRWTEGVDMSVSRRSFLEVTALGSLAAYCPAPATGATASLPTRVLGKTGVRVSILAMGGGSRYLQYKDEDRAIEAVQKALELGITYIDTSDDYGNNHLSERRIGKALKGRREPVFLATKLTHRDGAATARIVEQSLSALQRDHVDLIHIHSLTTEDDLARIEAKGGVLEQLQKLRDQKITRFIGITSHTDPSVLKMALERHDFDCTQMALNAALVGMKSGKNGM